MIGPETLPIGAGPTARLKGRKVERKAQSESTVYFSVTRTLGSEDSVWRGSLRLSHWVGGQAPRCKRTFVVRGR